MKYIGINEKSVLSIIIVLSVLYIVAKVSILSCILMDKENIVARYLTDDHYRYCPIVLEDDLYFPSDFLETSYNMTESIGMLGCKEAGKLNDSLFLSGALLVDEGDEERISLKVVDDLPMVYLKGDYLNRISVLRENLGKYQELVLCFDSDEEEYRTSFRKDYLLELIETFGRVTGNAEDYRMADKIGYIYVDSPDPTDSVHNRTFDTPIVYMGTFLFKDDKVYYGNLSNEIKNEWIDDFIDLANN